MSVETEGPAKVTTADRETYLAFNALPEAHAHEVREGCWDETTGMQAIAIHRIAARAEAEAAIVTWLRNDGDGHRHSARDSYLAEMIEAGLHRSDR